MDKRTFKKLDKEIGIPQWKAITASDPAHNWSAAVMQRVGCMMPAQACRVIKLLTGKCKFNAKSDFIPLHEALVKTVQDSLGIKVKGKYPDPKYFSVTNEEELLNLIATVRKDTMKAEDEQVKDVNPANGKATPVTKKKRGKATTTKKAGRKKVAKKTTSKKKTPGKKKAGKKTTTKKKGARRQSSSPLLKKGDAGPLSEVGGPRNWDKFDNRLEKRYRVNPDLEKVSGSARELIAESVNDGSGKKKKLSALVEDIGRGKAYMAINTKLIVEAK